MRTKAQKMQKKKRKRRIRCCRTTKATTKIPPPPRRLTDDQTVSSSMSSLGRLTLATDSETVGTDVIICDEKNRFVTKIAMISYFHDKTVDSRPLTVTRRGLIRALNSTSCAEGKALGQLETRRKEFAKREYFIKREHPDAWELLDEDYIKGYENCEIDFAARSFQTNRTRRPRFP